MSVAITIAAVVIAAVCALVAWQTTRDARRRSAARVAMLAARIDPSPRDAAGTMFAEPAGRQGLPLARLAAGAGTLLAVVLVVVLAGFLTTRRPAAAPAARVADVPLALTVLEHSGRPGQLVVSGEVRGPRPGSAEPLVAVVTAVGGAGQVLGIREAIVSQGPLTPGRGVPFAVSLAGIGGVERYRIAFRNGAQVVRHIDRRRTPAAP